MTNGDICQRITEKADCENAARELGLLDKTAKVVSNPSKPPYCYYKPDHGDGKRLRFNEAFNSTASCSSEINCLCVSGNLSIWALSEVYPHLILPLT